MAARCSAPRKQQPGTRGLAQAFPPQQPPASTSSHGRCATGRCRGEPPDPRPVWLSGAGSAPTGAASGTGQAGGLSTSQDPAATAVKAFSPLFSYLFAEKGNLNKSVRKRGSAPPFLCSGVGDTGHPNLFQGWVPCGTWSSFDSPRLRAESSRRLANPRSVGSSEQGAMSCSPHTEGQPRRDLCPPLPHHRSPRYPLARSSQTEPPLVAASPRLGSDDSPGVFWGSGVLFPSQIRKSRFCLPKFIP